MAASAGKFCRHGEAVCFFRIAGLFFTVISYFETAAFLYLSRYLFKMSWNSYLADILGYIVVLPRTVRDAAESTEYLLVEFIFINGIFKIYCSNFGNLYSTNWGRRWRSWLRHCATKRKVAASNSNGVNGFFHWHNPSSRTMALGWTQPLTEMSTRNVSWGKGGPCRLSWNLGA